MGSILTIAESFDNGSFDISSDIRTFEAFGFDALPLAVNQCTRLEVASAMNEIFASGSDLPEAVKIGIITSSEVVLGVAERLKRYKVSNIVVDPAIISEDGQILVTEDVFVSLSNKLFPLATILTPNPYEVELLSGMEVHSEEDLILATASLSTRFKCVILVKAYNSFGVDLLTNGEEYVWIPRGDSDASDQYSLSAAFACQLPNCESLEQAALSASQFVFGVVEEKAEEPKEKEIPFSTSNSQGAASTSEVKVKKMEEDQALARFREVADQPVSSDNTRTAVKTLTETLEEKKIKDQLATMPQAPKKDVPVVVDVDNFQPEPVIDETLSKSLQELRAKLDKLR